ncbi:hypothetical protein [Indiicoccus explosivorum]|nr:hypothetical protein [Indiicoccus explosivorum]
MTEWMDGYITGILVAMLTFAGLYLWNVVGAEMKEENEKAD